MIAETVRETVWEDSGADADTIGALLLARIEAAGATVAVEKLPKPRVFNISALTAPGAPAEVKCSRAATMDTDVHIHHGSSLKIRHVKWYLSDRDVPEPSLERPMLEALGLYTKQDLIAAADKYAGSVDAETLTKSL